MGVVVKLGGSLACDPLLKHWLAAIAGSKRDVVVVPGGGPFADQIRIAQKRWCFDEGTAHRMAILAMEQLGHMLAAMEPRLARVSSESEIAQALTAKTPAVWLPAAMTLSEPSLCPSWDVTSDSIAAWLATRLGVRRLILIKSLPPGEVPATLAGLQSRGVVDWAFSEYVASLNAPVSVLSREELDRLWDLLA